MCAVSVNLERILRVKEKGSLLIGARREMISKRVFAPGVYKMRDQDAKVAWCGRHMRLRDGRVAETWNAFGGRATLLMMIKWVLVKTVQEIVEIICW